MHPQQFQDSLAGIREEEPQTDNNGKGYDAYFQVRQIDKLGVENLPAEVTEVEDIGSPVDTNHDGCNSSDGQ
jgi:hypothetical protein